MRLPGSILQRLLWSLALLLLLGVGIVVVGEIQESRLASMECDQLDELMRAVSPGDAVVNAWARKCNKPTPAAIDWTGSDPDNCERGSNCRVLPEPGRKMDRPRLVAKEAEGSTDAAGPTVVQDAARPEHGFLEFQDPDGDELSPSETADP